MFKQSLSQIIEAWLGERDSSAIPVGELIDHLAKTVSPRVEGLRQHFRGTMVDVFLTHVRRVERRRRKPAAAATFIDHLTDSIREKKEE